MGFLEQQEGLSLNLCTIIHTLACLDSCSIHLYVLAVIKKNMCWSGSLCVPKRMDKQHTLLGKREGTLITTCRTSSDKAEFKGLQGSNLRLQVPFELPMSLPLSLGHRGSKSRCVKLTDALTTLPVCKFLDPLPAALTQTAFDVHSTWMLTRSPWLQTQSCPPLPSHTLKHRRHAPAVSLNAPGMAYNNITDSDTAWRWTCCLYFL